MIRPSVKYLFLILTVPVTDLFHKYLNQQLNSKIVKLIYIVGVLRYYRLIHFFGRIYLIMTQHKICSSNKIIWMTIILLVSTISLSVNIWTDSFNSSDTPSSLSFSDDVNSDNFDQSDLDPVVQDNLMNTLTGFSGGFQEQQLATRLDIKYFLQSPTVSIGFGISSVKVVIKNDPNISNVPINQVLLTFPESHKIDPIASYPIVSTSNYFIGSNTATKYAHFSKITYKNLYDKIDLEYALQDGNLKYNFYVYPGGNPNVIKMSWNSADRIEKTSNGIKIEINQQVLLDQNPIAYQTEMLSNPVIHFSCLSESSYGFSVSDYDRNSLLIIDPTILLSSTYVGGSGYDSSYGIAIDSNENIYVTGTTLSGNFPVVNAYNIYTNLYDVFVFKLSPNGSTLLYSTYIGGSNDDVGTSIAVDTNGNAYITGYTLSHDFPTINAYNSSYDYNYNAFIVKLSSDGSSLVYSTYVSGSDYDSGNDIAVDNNYNCYVIGETNSKNFPTTIGSFGGYTGAFVLKLSANGSTLVYSTIIGGSNYTSGSGLTLDTNDSIYITGFTDSADFPTVNAYNNTFTGSYDVFVSKLSADGSSLIYSTYVGGTGDDRGTNIALDKYGNAYITGYTASSDFPTVYAFNDKYGGSFYDTFAFKLSSNGSTLVYSTFIGGSGTEYANDIAVDGDGNAYIVGETWSSNYPIVNEYNNTALDKADAFVSKLSADGLFLRYSTLVGGSGNDYANSITIDRNGNAFITGSTNSSYFPTVNAYNEFSGGSYDVFVFKINTYSNLQNLTPFNVNVYTSTSKKSLNLVWDSPTFIDNLINYNIYRRNVTGNYLLVGSTQTAQFTDDSIVTGVSYYYTISANYTFGSGPNSTEVEGMLVIEPDAPNNLQITTGANSVYLTWNEPSSDGGAPIQEYKIFRGTESGHYSQVGTTTNLYFNDTNVVAGTMYYYVVVAVNVIGNSPNSVEAHSTPSGITVTNSTSQKKSSSIPGFTILSLLFLVTFLMVAKKVFKRKHH